MTAAGTTPATALDGLYASWLRSMRARNLAPATVRTYSTGARQFLDWLAANAPEVTTPEQVRRSDCETFLVELMARSSPRRRRPGTPA